MVVVQDIPKTVGSTAAEDSFNSLSLVKNLLRFQIKSTSTVYCMDKKIYLSLGDLKTHSHSREDTKSRL